MTESSPLTIPYPFRGIAEHDGGANYDKKDVEAIYQRETQFESVTVLRLPGVFGWGDYQRRFAALIEKLSIRKRSGQSLDSKEILDEDACYRDLIDWTLNSRSPGLSFPVS